MNNLNKNGKINDRISSPYIWLKKMLGKRDLVRPDKRNLYKYQINKNEFVQLKEVLLCNKNNLYSSLDYKYWAACFCLFVSEWYRREYDKKWSWDSVEALLDVCFTPQERTHLVEEGLEKYLGRSILKTSSGRRELIGSLFLEGGLPWPLIHSGHNFGNLVRKGLKEYYRVEKGGVSLFSIIEESKEYLPNAFQNNESLYLIVGIVDHLMEVGQQYDFKNIENPYLFLEQNDPNWKKDFPIPLDDSSAQNLVNDWLIDAGNRRRQMKELQDQEIPFKLTQLQMEDCSITKLKVKINYPAYYEMKNQIGENLSSTRFEIILYEGNIPIQHEGVVYASINDNKVTVRFQKSTSFALRKDIEAALNIRFMVGGEIIEKISFENSCINLKTPTIFCKREDGYEIVSDSSCYLKEAEARVRIPIGMTIESENMVYLGLNHKSKWYKISNTTSIFNKLNKYIIYLKAERNSRELQLSGRECLFETTPNTTFRGIPGYVDTMGNDVSSQDNQVLIDNEYLDYYKSNIAGKVVYKIINQDGHILLKRTIGILPSRFNLSVQPKDREHPAQVLFEGVEDCEVSLLSDLLFGRLSTISEKTIIRLIPKDNPPQFFEVLINSRNGLKPIRIKIPYPSCSVTVLDENENAINSSVLILNKLVGYRLILSSGLLGRHKFTVSLELNSRKMKYNQSIHYQYQVEDNPVIVNLYSLRDDMIQLLSSVQDQDAIIRITVMLDNSVKPVASFNVHQYEGFIDFHPDEFSIKDHTGIIVTGAEPVAFDVSNPDKKTIALNERFTQDVGTGFYTIDYSLLNDGPWLIIPRPESNIQFRPRIFCKKDNLHIPNEIKSLHAASKHFAINYDKSIFDTVIIQMINNLNHSGWAFIEETYANFNHLPFSTFEVWMAVARNNEALAILMFLCNFDVSVCYRIRNELSILWESIPIICWCKAYKKCEKYFLKKGLPEKTVVSLLDTKVQILGECISILRDLSGYVKGEKLKPYPVDQLLKAWNQATMNKHVDVIWPTSLGKELGEWIENGYLNGTVYVTEKNLPLTHYTKTVIYLPFFMARITLGLASLNELGHDIDNIKFQIKKIIDFDQDWFFPVHSLMTNFLIQKQNQEGQLCHISEI